MEAWLQKCQPISVGVLADLHSLEIPVQVIILFKASLKNVFDNSYSIDLQCGGFLCSAVLICIYI